jgi:superfamily II DNA or RNA helicase
VAYVYQGALGVTGYDECAAAAKARLEKDYDKLDKQAAKEITGTIARCAAVAACTAYGGAIVSSICGDIGEVVGEWLGGAIADAASWVGGIFGNDEAREQRKKLRKANFKKRIKAGDEARYAINTRWSSATLRTQQLYKKLFGKDLSLKQAQAYFQRRMLGMFVLGSGGYYETPYFAEPGSPGKGCLMNDTQGNSEWVRCNAKRTPYEHNYCSKIDSTTGEAVHPPCCTPKGTYHYGISKDGKALTVRTTVCRDPTKQEIAYVFAYEHLDEMAKYYELLVTTELNVTLSLISAAAEAEAKRIAAEVKAKGVKVALAQERQRIENEERLRRARALQKKVVVGGAVVATGGLLVWLIKQPLLR